MKTQRMMLHEALANASGHECAAITNDHMFNERHSYLTFDKHDQTITQVFYEASKGTAHSDAEGHDYKFVDSTINNLSLAFSPTPNDVTAPKWWVFTLAR